MQDRPAEIYGLMVPLDKEQLLVPRGCVAEVVGYQTPQEMTGAPPWYLGVITWNGRKVAKKDLPPLYCRRFVERMSKALEKGFISVRKLGALLDMDLAELTALFESHKMNVPFEL